MTGLGRSAMERSSELEQDRNIVTDIGVGNLSIIREEVPQSRFAIRRMENSKRQALEFARSMSFASVLRKWGQIVRDLRVLRGLIRGSEEVSKDRKQLFDEGLSELEKTWRTRISNTITSEINKLKGKQN